ncbi:MAG: OsmC family protein [Bacteroidota bacterium]
MKIKTQFVSDFVYEATNENGNTISIDMRDAEEKASQGPMEMVLSAVSGCAAVDIILMLRKKRKTIIDFIVESEAKRRDEPPRSFTSIFSKYILISPDTEYEELDKVAKLTLDKYCSVASSLNTKVEYAIEIRKSK